MTVKLYMDWTIAMPYLEPIYHYIKKNTDWDVHFTARDQDSIQMIKDRGYPFNQGIDNYDWAICCDGLSACPTRNRISTFHGLASKGQELSSNRTYRGKYISPGKYYTDILINRMGVKEEDIIKGGLTKFDTITEIPKLREEPKILYAPTHNPELSSIPILKDSILDINPTIKLHTYTATSDKPHHKKFRSYYPKQEDYTEDITDMILRSDIVVADLGSTAIEAIALGKMLIQVRNPSHRRFYEERKGISKEEYKTYPEFHFPEKYGYIAENMEEVKDIIENEYPNFKPPKEEIVSNIGNYKVSKILCEHLS